MNKILLFSNCNFIRKTFESILSDCALDFFYDLELCLNEVSDDITLVIHITDENFKIASKIFSQIEERWFKNIVIVTQLDKLVFLEYLTQRSLQFINIDKSTEFIKKTLNNKTAFKMSEKPRELLTQSEYRVIDLMVSGWRVTEIAFMLRRSVKTISSQKVGALRKLNLANKPQSLVVLKNILR